MKHALFATDASGPCIRAARTLNLLAQADPELQVTVLHVVPLPEVLTPAAGAGAPLTLPSHLDDYIQTRVPEILQAAVIALGLPSSRIRTLYFIGIPADTILEEARQGEYDLVVLGRRGLSPLKEMLVGSVSQAVLHRCPSPVLIVP